MVKEKLVYGAAPNMVMSMVFVSAWTVTNDKQVHSN